MTLRFNIVSPSDEVSDAAFNRILRIGVRGSLSVWVTSDTPDERHSGTSSSFSKSSNRCHFSKHFLQTVALQKTHPSLVCVVHLGKYHVTFFAVSFVVVLCSSFQFSLPHVFSFTSSVEVLVPFPLLVSPCSFAWCFVQWGCVFYMIRNYFEMVFIWIGIHCATRCDLSRKVSTNDSNDHLSIKTEKLKIEFHARLGQKGA